MAKKNRGKGKKTRSNQYYKNFEDRPKPKNPMLRVICSACAKPTLVTPKYIREITAANIAFKCKNCGGKYQNS